jgi:hypothetical protein
VTTVVEESLLARGRPQGPKRGLPRVMVEVMDKQVRNAMGMRIVLIKPFAMKEESIDSFSSP